MTINSFLVAAGSQANVFHSKPSPHPAKFFRIQSPKQI